MIQETNPPCVELPIVRLKRLLKREAYPLFVLVSVGAGALVFGELVSALNVFHRDQLWLLVLATTFIALPRALRRLKQRRAVSFVEQFAFAFHQGFLGLRDLLLRLRIVVKKLMSVS